MHFAKEREMTPLIAKLVLPLCRGWVRADCPTTLINKQRKIFEHARLNLYLEEMIHYLSAEDDADQNDADRARS